MNFSFDPASARRFFCLTLPAALALILGAMAASWLVTLPFTNSAPKVASNPHAPPSLGPGPSPDSQWLSVSQDAAPAPRLGSLPARSRILSAEPDSAQTTSVNVSPLGQRPSLAAPRPAEFRLPATPPTPVPRPVLSYSGGSHEVLVSLRNDTSGPSTHYDHWTAVYDLAAHTVYLPNGARLEAHSGLGDRLDDPLHVDEVNRGATPPHLYELTLREAPFHGVQALRLTPVGGGVFGRVGLLAHSYMLGPNGDSNGCVSFKDYDAFLQAYQSGQVKRLAVVASLR
jgi:hypothetical protein